MDGYAIRAADVAAATEDAPSVCAVIGEVRAGAAPEVGVERGSRDPDRDRRAAAAAAPTPSSRSSRRRRSTPTDAGRPARPRRDRAASRRRPRPRGGPRRATRVRRARRRPAERRRRSWPPGTRLTPAAVALAAGSGVDSYGPPPAAGRRPGDRRRGPRGGPAARAGRHPRRERPGPARRSSTSAGADAGRPGHRRDRLDGRPGAAARGAAGGRRHDRVRAACRSGRTTSSSAAFEEVGRIDLWRVAVQPGKPFAFGTRRAAGTGGGRCSSACPATRSRRFVTFELFVRPALRRLAGPDRARRPRRPGGAARARLEEPRPARLPAGRRRARRGRCAGARRRGPGRASGSRRAGRAATS